MALINKTASDTIERLGSSCAQDMMALFAPKDSTKDGLGLLTLMLNHTRSTSFLPAMLSAGYRIDPERLSPDVGDETAAAFLALHSAEQLGAHCSPRRSSASHALRWPLCQAKARLAMEAIAKHPPLGPDSARELIESSAACLSILPSERQLATRIVLFLRQTPVILSAISKNPNASAAAFDWLSTPACSDLLHERACRLAAHAAAHAPGPTLLRLANALNGSMSLTPAAGPILISAAAKAQSSALSAWASIIQSSGSALASSWAATAQANAIAGSLESKRAKKARAKSL